MKPSNNNAITTPLQAGHTGSTAFPPPLIPLMTTCILLTAGANKRAQLVDNEELIEAIRIIEVTL
jgi:hypothetical protein